MRNFILGTDWWTDCDDCMALRILCRAHKKGEINLMGVCLNAIMEDSTPSLSAFMNAEGLFGIPIGADQDATDYIGNVLYQQRLAKMPHEINSNEEAMEGVAFYRKLLAQSTEPVEILEIGFLQVVGNLLESEPDEYSPLDGISLVSEKVRKFWIMAGKWDEDGGRENNLCQTTRASVGAEKFCRLCPVPVEFLGWECGNSVISGGNILPENDVLRTAMTDFGAENGRNSWDPLTAILALDDNPDVSGYKLIHGTATVEAQNGKNHFTRDENGLHCYTVMLKNVDFYSERVNEKII